MKKSTSIILGIILIALGVIFALNALELTNIDIFFDGWWTLFIIVPCLIGLFKGKDKLGNLIGIGIGVFLLLCARDILSFSLVWKLLVPVIIILVGVNLITKSFKGSKAKEITESYKVSGEVTPEFAAVFSGRKVNFDNQNFEGANITAVFGGVDLDLRNAQIRKDCVINVSATFGGIDILLPANVNASVSATGIFGGVSDKRRNSPGNTVTVYITGLCMFGGADIK